MTRRKFIQKAMETGSAIFAGIFWLVRKTGLRKFVRAGRIKDYPGPLGPLRDICKQGKWSG